MLEVLEDNMAKKQKMYRIPLDVWNLWFNKKQAIENRIKVNTNKNVNVPMTHILNFYGSKKMFLWDDEILNYFLARKRSRKTGSAV
jgi:hypothetical protein